MSPGSRVPGRHQAAVLCLVAAVASAPLALSSIPPARAADAPPGPWQPSPDLVVSEVVTGGASASDEWIEIHDRGTLAADLGGLELVYVTASGGTVTRKASWQQLVLKPGASLLLANASGVFASLADDTWSGGLASAGGTIALRVAGGEVVDSLSWGTASSAWVEGRPGLAPPAGSSLERLPDGDDRNGRDTNDNRDDTWIQSQPVPDARHVDQTPEPTERPTPTRRPTPEPTERPTPEPTERPTPEPTERPTPEPTERPTPSRRTPTPEPGPPSGRRPSRPSGRRPSPPSGRRPSRPSGRRPSPPSGRRPSPPSGRRPSPPQRPTPEPTAAPLDISVARGLALGTMVTIKGVLTTPPGLTDGGRGAFLQDDTAGIALYLSSTSWPPIPMGHRVRASGSIASRYGLLTLSLASSIEIVDGGPGDSPDPVAFVGQSPESVEGRLVSVQGTVSGSPDALADGYAVDLVDGASTQRVVVATGTGIDAASLPSGRRVVVTGVMGQHASTAAATNGYRVWPRSSSDIADIATPTPGPSGTPVSQPTATPGRTATPAPTQVAGPTPTPTPSARPTATPRPTTTPRPTATPASVPVVSIAAARGMPVGSRLAIEGTVTAVPGRVLRAGVTFLQDGTGGLAVELPDGLGAAIKPGAIVQLSGKLTDPYANLELRAAGSADVVVLGRGGLPSPVTLTSSGLTETREGQLARMTGIIDGVETGSSGSLAVTLRDNGGEARIFVFGAVGVTRDRFTIGARLVATGIVGQRESTAGAGDGYRLWPRESGDLVMAAATPTNRPGGGATPRPTATARPGSGTGSTSTVRIGSVRGGDIVTIQGTVTAPTGLLDGEGRRQTVQDGTGAILLRLPDGAAQPSVGTRIRVSGEVGTWYGGLQLASEAAPSVLGRTAASPVVLRRAPGAHDEWRLVRVTVRITDVSRSGDTWRAEASLGAGGGLPIVGLAGSHIPSTALAEGRSATITGIVKRAYPTAADQRFALVPRGPVDIQLGRDPALVGGGPREADATGAPASSQPGDGPGTFTGTSSDSVVDATLDALTALAGRHVRVSGALRHIDRALLTIDDGSASAIVRLLDDGATFQPPLAPGEVLNVTGVVAERDVGGWEVLARSEALVRASSLSLPTPAPPYGDAVSVAGPSPEPSPAIGAASAGVPPATTGPGDPLGLLLALAVAVVAALVVVTGGALMTRPRRRRGRDGDPATRPTAAATPVPQTRPGERPDGALDAP